jgi:hypothetical protein
MNRETGKFFTVLALSALLVQPAWSASAAQSTTTQLLASALGSYTQEVMPLDAGQMAETEGQLLPIIAAVVTIDFALAGFFWGIYVPHYSSSKGACLACSQPTTKTH